jgi:GDPmannose 4,6-dehydratase
MKRALITGITGQDSSYLAKSLLEKGYKVYGAHRKTNKPNFWRLQHFNIYDKIDFVSFDLLDSKSISKMLDKTNPDVVYNNAAQSFVASSFDQPVYTTDVTGSGVIRMLEGIKNFNDKIKFFQAASSEMYGLEKSITKNEKTHFHPISPYSIAKVHAYWITRMYREAYGMFAVNGILFNHESPMRGIEFVTRKISNGVAKISLGLEKNLKLGNLSAQRDWGYAPEYIEGIISMMSQKKSDDYILATNETHSIKEFVDEACKVANISNSKIKSSKENFRLHDVQRTKGSYKKAKKELGWSPKTKFKKIVKIMVEADIERWEKFLKKEPQTWDLGK